MQRPATRRLVATILPLALAATAGAVELKIATVAPDGSFWMKEARRGAAEIGRRTEGRVGFRFYPGGTMGREEAVLRKIRIGQLHGAALLSGSMATIDRDLDAYSLPLFFASYDEVDAVRRHVDPLLIARLEEKGYLCFGIIEGGFAYLMSSRPTRSFDDLKGQKAWIPEGDVVGKAILDAAGLAPIPLPLSDVLTGLQTGLIDTVAGPAVGAVALQWFTRVKYLTDLPIVYTYGGLVLSQKALRRIDEADLGVVKEVLGEVSQALDRRTRADNDAARAALVKQGVEVVEVEPATLERWREVAAEATDRLLERGMISREMLAELERRRDEARAPATPVAGSGT